MNSIFKNGLRAQVYLFSFCIIYKLFESVSVIATMNLIAVELNEILSAKCVLLCRKAPYFLFKTNRT